MPPRDPNFVLADLDHLVPILYKVVEAGFVHARGHYAHHETIEPNTYTFSSLVREGMRQHFEALGRTVDNCGIDQTQRNVAIHIRYRGCLSGRRYNLRLLKSRYGRTPVPQKSKRCHGFYLQHDSTESFLLHEQTEFQWEDAGDADYLNLLVLWEATATWAMSPYLTLVCPNGTAEFGQDVPSLWEAQIPAPHTPPVSAPPTEPSTNDDLDNIELIEAEEEEDG